MRTPGPPWRVERRLISRRFSTSRWISSWDGCIEVVNWRRLHEAISGGEGKRISQIVVRKRKKLDVKGKLVQRKGKKEGRGRRRCGVVDHRRNDERPFAKRAIGRLHPEIPTTQLSPNFFIIFFNGYKSSVDHYSTTTTIDDTRALFVTSPVH